MKRIFVIWIILAVACVAYLYPHRKELGLYWREWSSFQRHFVCNDKGWNLRRPFLSETITRQDPEAAAIVELIFRDHRGDSHRSESKDIDDLSSLSLKYPDNQYFLYELACRLASRAYVDPQIINSIADRLLQLDPDNGRYHSLKAWAAFYDWDDNRAEKALEYLEKCFSFPNNQDPYNHYKARVCNLMDKEKPTSLISDWSARWRTLHANFLGSLLKDLLVYTQDLIVNSESGRAMQIHDRLQRLAEKSVPQKIETPWEVFYLSFGNRNLLFPETPQTIELKWMNLDPQRAKQNRLQLLAWDRLIEDITAQRNANKTSCREFFYTIGNITAPVTAHCFQIVLVAFVVMLVFLVIGITCGIRIAAVSRWSFLWATLFCCIYFAACRFTDYGAMFTFGHSHYTFDMVLSSSDLMALLLLCKPFGIYGLITAGLASGVLGFIFLGIHKRPNLLWRVIIKVLSLTLLVSLWVTVSRLQAGTVWVDLLVLMTIVSLLCTRIRDVKNKNYVSLFGTSEESKQYRFRCIAITSYILLLHLAEFSLLFSPLARCTRQVVENATVSWRPIYPPRFSIDPNAYPELLTQIETQKPWTDLHEWLYMVEPADMPKALTVVKERRKSSSDGRSSRGKGELFSFDGMVHSGAEIKHIDEYLPDLSDALRLCSKDAIPYAMPFFKDPNHIDVLMLRGRLGDTSVRKRLVEAWKKNRDAGFPARYRPPYETLDPNTPDFVRLWAMVGICPYLEVRDYILEYGRWSVQQNEQFVPDREWMEYLTRQQKGDLIAQWVSMIKEMSFEEFTILDLLQYNSQLDRTSQEWLWKQIITYGNNQDKRYDLGDLDLEHKPSDYHISDELLADCLNNKNERLRAMGQHIWRKQGKPLDEQILQRWAGDSNFVIRADVALLRPDKIPASDPSPFVRLIQNLAK